jgi:hypothetical protein
MHFHPKNQSRLFRPKTRFFARPNFQTQTIDQSLNPLKKKASDINQHMIKFFCRITIAFVFNFSHANKIFIPASNHHKFFSFAKIIDFCIHTTTSLYPAEINEKVHFLPQNVTKKCIFESKIKVDILCKKPIFCEMKISSRQPSIGHLIYWPTIPTIDDNFFVGVTKCQIQLFLQTKFLYPTSVAINFSFAKKV